jgi:opacity protein-like surface antigen
MKTLGAALPWVVLLSLAASGAAVAQETPRVEVFGGYSLLHADDATRNGWEGSLRFALSTRFGIEAGVSQHYGKLEGDSDRTTLAAGPVFTLRPSRVFSVYAHALGGVAREKASIDVFGVDISESHTSFTLLAGAGVDLRLKDFLALRLVQADWAYTRVDGEGQSGLRVSAGLVLRLGTH